MFGELISKGESSGSCDTDLQAFWNGEEILELKKGFMSLLLSKRQAQELQDWLNSSTLPKTKELNSSKKDCYNNKCKLHNVLQEKNRCVTTDCEYRESRQEPKEKH